MAAAALLLVSSAADAAQTHSWCRSHPQRVGQCRDIHGRLSPYNGTPTYRIWILGTRRMLGVVGRSGHDLGDEYPLPANLETAFGPRPFDLDIFGDFRVCPLTRARPGVMQSVYVVRGRHLLVRRR
ncbi:MAG: hypothetical protein JO276_02805 [Sphingomonadaceae bacterium]|nr:hypothetical protein [Sphingomonadaceae bacterium]